MIPIVWQKTSGSRITSMIPSARRRPPRKVVSASLHKASRRFLFRRTQLVDFAFPFHLLRKRQRFFGHHEDGFLFCRIGAADDVLHVTRNHVFHNRDQIGVDARMAGYMLLPMVEESGGKDMHAVRAMVRSRAYDENRLCRWLLFGAVRGG